MTVCAASYDADGKMLTVNMVQADLKKGMNQIYLPLAQTGAEVRVFLLRDGNWKPLAPSLRQ